MKKTVGCLHAHYSNIEYIEKAFLLYDIEFIHFVDPALMYRVTFDENFKFEDAQRKVKEQLEWMAQYNVDAILITCTNYITLLPEDDFSMTVPIIKIDEPYFKELCNIENHQTILFTNPATVKGTMERLIQYANKLQKTLDVEAIVIDNTFELIMKGLKQQYNQEVIKFLLSKVNPSEVNEKKVVSVAQLSMVAAAKEVEVVSSQSIINPLDSLISFVVSQLELDIKKVEY